MLILAVFGFVCFLMGVIVGPQLGVLWRRLRRTLRRNRHDSWRVYRGHATEPRPHDGPHLPSDA